jgi:hypothetical protein
MAIQYRVKQISENRFIPQVKTSFFSNWKSISRYNPKTTVLIFESILCWCDTLEQAKEVIKKNKEYPKYYDIK